MKPIDKSYQAAVDNEADKVFKLSIDELIMIEDYGSIEATIDGNEISICFWHYKLSDKLHHIVFVAARSVYLIFTKKYLSGVKLENGNILKLSDKEIGVYD